MDDWLRKGGKTPDGRDILAVHAEMGAVWFSCDPTILDRAKKNLPIPGPTDSAAPDGYRAKWEITGLAKDV